MKKPSIKPCGIQLLVAPAPDTERAHQGIVIPEAYKDQDRVFRVLAVGGRVKEIHPQDRVVAFSHTSGFVPLDDGTNRGFLTTNEVLAILPGPFHPVNVGPEPPSR